MARRRSTPKELREAVERTVQVTRGSAERTRGRAQDAVDELVEPVVELVRGAEAGLTRSRRAVADAIDDRLPATQDDVRALHAELRKISRRLDAIEEKLPAGATRAGKRRTPSRRS